MSNGVTLKQTEAVISLEGRYLQKKATFNWRLLNFKCNDVLMQPSTHLAQREVLEELRSAVRLSEGEGRAAAGNFDASATVLGSNLGLEGPPVLWVRVQSLKCIKQK